MFHTVEREKERLAVLDHYEIMDTPAEKQFDDLLKLAGEICGTPMALISLVDAKRQWFKAKIGIDIAETPREISACQYALTRPDVLVIPDMEKDERFVNNPFVTGEAHLRFYAGAPLKTPSGHNIGTLCILDNKPGSLTDFQKSALQTLSAQVVVLLELRLALREKKMLKEQLAKLKK